MLNWTEELKAAYPETYAYCMEHPGLFANQPRRLPGEPKVIKPRDEVTRPPADVLDTTAEANVFFFNRPKNKDA